ncbi:MAG TPA: recombinase family protein [Bryobacteraceae bacterium]|jgi:hypothetical protein|nr:recombinase family protein [Bryobacteraceae bacterium]
MARIQRMYEPVLGPPDAREVERRRAEGWSVVGVTWERRTEGPAWREELALSGEIPFGLTVAADCSGLAEEASEKAALLLMLSLIVQEAKLDRIAIELNRRGHRTRAGAPWNAASVFDMLPRLIEVGAQVFPTEEWQVHKRQLLSTT